MMKVFYQGSAYNVSIEDIEQAESAQIEKIRADMIEHFDAFCLSYGAKIDLFDNRSLLDTMIVSPHRESGIYLQYLENSGDAKNYITYLSLYDDSKLNETVETFDEIYASRGLFLPTDLAWDAVLDFITSGVRSSKIAWITPESIPEGGNW